MHSLLSVRVILHLREADARTVNRSGFITDLSLPSFASPDESEKDALPDLALDQISIPMAESLFDGSGSERGNEETYIVSIPVAYAGCGRSGLRYVKGGWRRITYWCSQQRHNVHNGEACGILILLVFIN